ncbi:hypothetical protein Goari_021926, partial [Gossypium aridum]|nr:hypothetical protein [Gossypium aridum]
MALEAVIFQQDLLGYNSNWSHDFGLGKPESKDSFGCFPDNQTPEINHFAHGDYWVSTTPTSSMAVPVPYHHQLQHHCPNSSSDAANVNGLSSSVDPFDASTTPRPKRRRFKPRKNKQEIENQRMTHIAVERNRRKQMNDYLSVLRCLMPESYVQRGDQASIIGGAINFVKELEHRLQCLSAEKE